MSHDDSTYLDEGRDYLAMGDDGQATTVVPLQSVEGRRWGHLDEEAWGGWDVVE
ncbi:hypothetical protein G4177_19730 [Corallococcus sp. ZKHCc1 1396]|uniref:Uncharacterized protein n=1 Tax=Corallococcus soli TaxID=2710757 RepID=A0ABR9PR56_9BACT|nr:MULTISPECIES: hypothetical protein [Corallococcus]MBE4750402.1 hypothetical protein [Corallococcus soli]MCY1032975.1 hypothetical protein [Corallococcus sp. BB11-1]